MMGIRVFCLLVLVSTPCYASIKIDSKIENLVRVCAPDISPVTLKAVITTESSLNPYAIGVVGGHLTRQARNLDEALATVANLEKRGYNFSVGLGQVNRYNVAKYRETYQTAFEPCQNLKLSSLILKKCYGDARGKIPDEQQALRAAFSCYYSGNFTRGFKKEGDGKPSYVEQVLANAEPITVVPEIKSQPSEVQVHITKPAKASPFVKFPDEKLPNPPSAPAKNWVTFTDKTVSPQPSPEGNFVNVIK